MYELDEPNTPPKKLPKAKPPLNDSPDVDMKVKQTKVKEEKVHEMKNVTKSQKSDVSMKEASPAPSEQIISTTNVAKEEEIEEINTDTAKVV